MAKFLKHYRQRIRIILLLKAFLWIADFIGGVNRLNHNLKVNNVITVFLGQFVLIGCGL